MVIAGLAVQWGAIADVGVVQERFGNSDIVIGGTIPQKLNSCFIKLEKFLLSGAAVVSSYIPAVSSADHKFGEKGIRRKRSLLSSVCAVVGKRTGLLYLYIICTPSVELKIWEGGK